ncbi:hypothetical protein J2755_001679 [Methanohalophilus levihalophilus]|uniref:hypothetical protein n=1 Tax=Methanohalophilus levihalophilus TaxID=1431282 RepID=UPI001AE623A9|nr:hypothetical protein [Methanohalophilus levihalophilus]MBP2030731.1 hypothetical protein [Methanohalophilus levihalophilus]
MSEHMNELPVIQKSSQDEKKSSACDGCETKGCCGALGIRAGAEKEEVYRNLTIYLILLVVIVVGAYILKNLMSLVLS